MDRGRAGLVRRSAAMSRYAAKRSRRVQVTAKSQIRYLAQSAMARRLKAALRKDHLNARDRNRFIRDFIEYVFSKPRPRRDAVPTPVTMGDR